MPNNINLIVNETIDNVIINPSTTNDIVDVNIYETVSSVDVSITEVVENVSILVDETITSVNIVVDETIDLTTINVTDTPTNVDITVNPINTVVNLNKVTSIGGTDLSYTPSPTNGTVVSSIGTPAVIPLTDSTNAGLLSPSEKIKLTNTSGTNSGDETTSTIKSKLGITTLSGSNTGDQNLSSYATTTYVNTQDALKVDKVTDSRLINNTEIGKLALTSGTNTGDQNISLQAVLTAGDSATDKRIILFQDITNYDAIEINLSADSDYGDFTTGVIVFPALSSQNSFYSTTYNGIGFFKVNAAAWVYAEKFIKNGGTGLNILLDNGTTLASSSKENYLSVPPVNGFVLSSTIAGVRSWVAQSGGGGVSNLSYTPSPTNGTVVSSTGTPAVIPLTDSTNAGLLSPSEKTKLALTSGTNTGDQTLSGLGGVASNTSITAATNTKITYDAKGLVTAGSSLIASDIPTIAQSQVTSLTTDLANKQPLNSNLTNISSITSNGLLRYIIGSGVILDSTFYPSDSTVVHNTGAETITGVKTFSNSINLGLSATFNNTIAYINSSGILSGLVTAGYPTLAELAYVKGTTSNIQTQFSNKQSTSTSAYTMLANNSASGGLMTPQSFKDIAEQTLTSALVWTPSAPVTSLGVTYRWSLIGGTVNARFNLNYTTAAASLTQLTIALPSDMPNPVAITGFTSALDFLATGVGNMSSSKALPTTAVTACGLRRNAANTSYEFVITKPAGSVTTVWLSIQYFI